MYYSRLRVWACVTRVGVREGGGVWVGEDDKVVTLHTTRLGVVTSK